MAVYVHFARFMDLTISSHVNPYYIIWLPVPVGCRKSGSPVDGPTKACPLPKLSCQFMYFFVLTLKTVFR